MKDLESQVASLMIQCQKLNALNDELSDTNTKLVEQVKTATTSSASVVYNTPSNKKPSSRRASLHESREKAQSSYLRSTKSSSSTATVQNTTKTMIVGGQTLHLREKPTDTDVKSKIWDKTTRSSHTVEEKLAWTKEATKYVLTKHNKLSIPDVDATNPKYLVAIRNARLQLQLLEKHMYAVDIVDVLTIVVPVDLMQIVDIEDEFDFFQDYPKLSIAHVANSCAWYNKWTDAQTQPWIGENMQTIYDCLQRNTDEGLWNKALEDYNRYQWPHIGGPLMFAIILHRQIKSNETALQSVAEHLAAIKIRDEPGEDVEEVCARIEAGYKALENASGEGHNYMPNEFPKQVLAVLRTSSVGRFNKVFADEYNKVISDAARSEVMPVWPEVPVLLRLARNWYNNIKDDLKHGGWNVSKKQQAKALTAGGEPGGKDSNSNSNSSTTFVLT